MNEKQINDVLFAPSDRWLTPQECKKFGLCDRVTDYLDIPDPTLATLRRPRAPAKKTTVKKTVKRSARGS
jgi:hypothetical protein